MAASDSILDSSSDSLSDSQSENTLGCWRLLLSRRGEFDVRRAVVLRARSFVRASWAALTVCTVGSKGSVPASGRPATHRVGARTSAHAGYTRRRTNGKAHHAPADGGSSTGLQRVVSRLAAGLVTRKTAVCLWPPCQIVLLAAQLVASSVHPSQPCATDLVRLLIAGLNIRYTLLARGCSD